MIPAGGIVAATAGRDRRGVGGGDGIAPRHPLRRPPRGHLERLADDADDDNDDEDYQDDGYEGSEGSTSSSPQHTEHHDNGVAHRRSPSIEPVLPAKQGEDVRGRHARGGVVEGRRDDTGACGEAARGNLGVRREASQSPPPAAPTGRLADRIRVLRERCHQGLGEATFERAYRYLKVRALSGLIVACHHYTA